MWRNPQIFTARACLAKTQTSYLADSNLSRTLSKLTTAHPPLSHSHKQSHDRTILNNSPENQTNTRKPKVNKRKSSRNFWQRKQKHLTVSTFVKRNTQGLEIFNKIKIVRLLNLSKNTHSHKSTVSATNLFHSWFHSHTRTHKSHSALVIENRKKTQNGWQTFLLTHTRARIRWAYLFRLEVNKNEQNHTRHSNKKKSS